VDRPVCAAVLGRLLNIRMRTIPQLAPPKETREPTDAQLVPNLQSSSSAREIARDCAGFARRNHLRGAEALGRMSPRMLAKTSPSPGCQHGDHPLLESFARSGLGDFFELSEFESTSSSAAILGQWFGSSSNVSKTDHPPSRSTMGGEEFPQSGRWAATVPSSRHECI
jgi:hypothetical protein